MTIQAPKHSGLLVVQAAVVALIAFLVGVAALAVVSLSSDAPWAHDQQQLTWIVVALALACITAGAVSVTIVHFRVVKPLEGLANSIDRVGKGDLNTKVDERVNAMMRTTFMSFNQMAYNLSDIDTLRENFIANVSHELKTPLARIQNNARLLQFDDDDSEKRNDYLEQIVADTALLANMTGTMLDMAALDANEFAPAAQPYQLDEQIRHVLAHMIPSFEEHGKNYQVELESVQIVANEGMVEKVWVNLLSNADKFTQTGGTISVTLHSDGQHAIVAVSDTGCGMTPEQAANVFKRFYRVQHDEVPTGNGLGLAISKEIVEKHRGTISVESELGVGTCFTVELPLE